MLAFKPFQGGCPGAAGIQCLLRLSDLFLITRCLGLSQLSFQLGEGILNLRKQRVCPCGFRGVVLLPLRSLGAVNLVLDFTQLRVDAAHIGTRHAACCIPAVKDLIERGFSGGNIGYRKKPAGFNQ